MQPTVPQALGLIQELGRLEWRDLTPAERQALGSLTSPPELSDDAKVAVITGPLASWLEAASEGRAPLGEMQGGLVYCSDRDGLETIISFFPKPDAPGEESMRFCFGAEWRMDLMVAG